uniref:ANK_REP_REGION domain-containing protein n=1 Tax=Parastrongyloides trichosuri TaxID=131310 RepID=A0A0N4YZZ7_PARTI
MNVNQKTFLALCEEGNDEEIAKILERKNKNGLVCFLRKIFNRKNVNGSDLSKIKNPKNEYSSLHYGVLSNNVKLVKLLLDTDPSLIHSTDVKGSYPISLAAYNGYYEIVEMLLEKDIKIVDYCNNAKDSPLHLSSRNGHVKVVSLLLNRHCNSKMKNARNETALDVACKYGHIQVCQILIVHCPEFVIQSKTDSHNAEAGNNETKNMYPLHICAQNGHDKCLNYLCESGFDVNHTLKEGTALHVAAIYGNINCIFVLLKHGIDIKILNERGLDVIGELDNHINHHGNGITQIMENKDVWYEAKKLLESYKKGVSVAMLELSQNMNNNKIWMNIPENANVKNEKIKKKEENEASNTKKQINNVDLQFQNELKEKLEKRQAKANDLQEIYKQLSNVNKSEDIIYNKKNEDISKHDRYKYKVTSEKPPISPTSSLKSNGSDTKNYNNNKCLKKPLIDEKNMDKQMMNDNDNKIVSRHIQTKEIKTSKTNHEQNGVSSSYDNVDQVVVEAQHILNCHVQATEDIKDERNWREISPTTSKFPKTKEEVYELVNEIKKNELLQGNTSLSPSTIVAQNVNGTFRYDNLGEVWKDVENEKNKGINIEIGKKNDNNNGIVDESCKALSPKTKSQTSKKVTFEESTIKDNKKKEDINDLIVSTSV